MTDSSAEEAGRVIFHYIKANGFRVVHVDGAVGSLTASGNIHCALYSERPAIPQRLEQPIAEDGRFLDEGASFGRSGMVRELDVDLVMSRVVAERLRDWFSARLQEWDEAAGAGAWNEQPPRSTGTRTKKARK